MQRQRHQTLASTERKACEHTTRKQSSTSTAERPRK